MENRVISLLPAAAESLHFIGGGHLLVGRGYCDDFPPESVQDIPVVTAAKVPFTTSEEVDRAVSAMAADAGSLYWIDAERIVALRPTVILTQGLCSVCAVSLPAVQRVAERINPPPQIVDLSPSSVDDIINDLIRIGDAVGLSSEAQAAASSLHQRIAAAVALVPAALRPASSGLPPAASGAPPSAPRGPVVAFLEWTEPLFPGGHWTPQLLALAGARHPLNPPLDGGTGPAAPSQRVPPEAVAAADPDWVLVCPCGLDLATARDWWRQLRAVRAGRVVLVDGGQMFNRSGPRVVDALEWLVALLHRQPQLSPPGFPWEWWEAQEGKDKWEQLASVADE